MVNQIKDRKTGHARPSMPNTKDIKDTELLFATTAKRPAARYVSASMVCEEALDHGRWIGLYWSATGHVHRENVTSGFPKLSLLQYLLLNGIPVELDAALTGELVMYEKVYKGTFTKGASYD